MTLFRKMMEGIFGKEEDTMHSAQVSPNPVSEAELSKIEFVRMSSHATRRQETANFCRAMEEMTKSFQRGRGVRQQAR